MLHFPKIFVRNVVSSVRYFSHKSESPVKAFTALTMSHCNLLKTENGQCIAEMTVTKQDTNFFGTMHGGLTATLVDEITTVALMSNSPGQSGGMSVNMNITYMAPAKLGETIVIEAQTAKCGKTLAFLNCSIREKNSKRLIAQGSHTKYVGQDFLIIVVMNAIRHAIFKIAYFGYNTSLGRRYWLRKLNDWHSHASAHGLSSHSLIEPMQFGKVEVVAIPIGFDNYSYLIRCEGVVVIVDVGDPEAVLSYLNELGVTQVNAVLITHKHWDHQHGADTVASRYQGCVVYGGKQDFHGSSSIRQLSGGSEINVGNYLKFLTVPTPGHTSGHTCYILLSGSSTDSNGHPFNIGCDDMLFSGDHLFLYGCGRVFESPFHVMLESFDKLLSIVNDRTLVFPGHEYTLINLQFTLYVLPNDTEILQCFENALRLRVNHKKTCPETWAQQKRCNLFLRYKDEVLLKRLAEATGTPESEATPLELFAMLRKLKDQFSSKSRNQDGSSSGPSNSSQANIATIVAKIQQERIQQDINSSSPSDYKKTCSLHGHQHFNRRRSQNSLSNPQSASKPISSSSELNSSLLASASPQQTPTIENGDRSGNHEPSEDSNMALDRL